MHTRSHQSSATQEVDTEEGRGDQETRRRIATELHGVRSDLEQIQSTKRSRHSFHEDSSKRSSVEMLGRMQEILKDKERRRESGEEERQSIMDVYGVESPTRKRNANNLTIKTPVTDYVLPPLDGKTRLYDRTEQSSKTALPSMDQFQSPPHRLSPEYNGHPQRVSPNGNSNQEFSRPGSQYRYNDQASPTSPRLGYQNYIPKQQANHKNPAANSSASFDSLATAAATVAATNSHEYKESGQAGQQFVRTPPTPQTNKRQHLIPQISSPMTPGYPPSSNGGPPTAVQPPQNNGTNSRAAFMALFESLYDTASDDLPHLLATLRASTRKSAALLQTLQASGAMIEGLVRTCFADVSRGYGEKVGVALADLNSRLEGIEAGKNESKLNSILQRLEALEKAVGIRKDAV